jgi:hypothetical protein
VALRRWLWGIQVFSPSSVLRRDLAGDGDGEPQGGLCEVRVGRPPGF